MSKQVAWSLIALVSLSINSSLTWADIQQARNSPAVSCDAIANTDFSGIDEAPTQIQSARLVKPSDVGVEIKNEGIDVSREMLRGVPKYCRVRGYVAPQVGFELQLPATGWNGKFIEIGCGGSCGTLDWTFWCPLHTGYACIVSDMGHSYGGRDDGLWAYNNNLQAQIDFGYRGPHVIAVAGKAITERYYGQAPKYSYFWGCSTGSRQGLILAQRFPWDFDGIIAGGVWVDDTFSSMSLIWGARVLRGESGKPLLTNADVKMIHEAVLAKCDMDDGVKDGLVSNPLACTFDPTELRCKNNQQSGCLTETQVDALNKMYSGVTTSTGVRLTPGGPVPGSELNWIQESEKANCCAYISRDGEGIGEHWSKEYFRWMVLPPAGRTWNTTDFDFDRDYKRFSNGAQESLLSDTNPDLRKFKAAGGKLLLYEGWQDSELPRKTIDYFQIVERSMGGTEATRGFFRLFMVPGMAHCVGGEGAWAIDYLSYMEDWVEKGKAPDRMIGAHLRDDRRNTGDRCWVQKFPLDPSTAISFTRPVYPYPLWAKYKGSGDPNNAENFFAVEH